MQVSNVVFFSCISITVVIASSEPTDSENYYDRNSIDLNKKLLSLFLRLAYNTANRVVQLQNAARTQATNKLGTELQNLTLKDIIHGQEQSDHQASESPVDIQSRSLFPIEFKSVASILEPVKRMNPISTIANHLETLAVNKNNSNASILDVDPMPIINSGVENILSLGGNKSMISILNQSGTLLSDTPISLDKNSSSVGNLQSNVENVASKIPDQNLMEEIQANVENGVPELRFLPDIEIDNGTEFTSVNDSPKNVNRSIESYKSIVNNTKSETMAVQLKAFEQNEQEFNQSQAVPDVDNEKRLSVPVHNPDERSRRNTEELDVPPCEDKAIDDMFKFSFDENDDKYNHNLDELISKMKLQDIVNQISRSRK